MDNALVYVHAPSVSIYTSVQYDASQQYVHTGPPYLLRYGLCHQVAPFVVPRGPFVAIYEENRERLPSRQRRPAIVPVPALVVNGSMDQRILESEFFHVLECADGVANWPSAVQLSWSSPALSLIYRVQVDEAIQAVGRQAILRAASSPGMLNRPQPHSPQAKHPSR